MMSAGFVSLIQERTGIPAAVVAGALEIDGMQYFHSEAQDGGKHPLDGSTLEWDGHAWALVGDHVVDLSIFRTAYSGFGPLGLREKVMLRFGPGCGAFIANLRKAHLEGMEYYANYVLSDEQAQAFAIGAKAIVNHAHQGPD